MQIDGKRSEESPLVTCQSVIYKKKKKKKGSREEKCEVWLFEFSGRKI